MQSHDVIRPKATEILVGPPRSGIFSVYSTKLTALAFVWLCSLVTWANTANYGAVFSSCDVRCIVVIAVGVFVWFYSSLLLSLNWLAESNRLSRNGFFSHGLEVWWIGFLVLFWIPIIITVSKYPLLPAVAVWFSWAGFFASIYATFKAYHSFKEEDLPSQLPDGFEEEDHVYG